jgi:hypothetical protein
MLPPVFEHQRHPHRREAIAASPRRADSGHQRPIYEDGIAHLVVKRRLRGRFAVWKARPLAGQF